METRWFKLNTHDITLFQFIIEGYEGLATVTTIDPDKAFVQVSYILDFAADMNNILKNLENIFIMEEIPQQVS
jgi:hypothetical protein